MKQQNPIKQALIGALTLFSTAMCGAAFIIMLYKVFGN